MTKILNVLGNGVGHLLYEVQIKEWLAQEDVVKFRTSAHPNFFGMMSVTDDIDEEVWDYILSIPRGTR